MKLLDKISRKLQRVDRISDETLDVFAKNWTNSRPVSLSSLKGQVVLVAFTGDDANIFYKLNLWDKMFPCFQVICLFFQDKKGIKRVVKDNRISFPIALDDNSRTSDALKVTSRPAFYLFDKKGRLRFRLMNADLDRVGTAILRLSAEPT
ncbi:MAG: peroxiredoxin family protein [Candidatus Nanoarchaeia archaeon]